VLAERLLELAEVGLVSRAVTDGPPVTVRYELTTAGAELVPTISQLGLWAQRNLATPSEEHAHWTYPRFHEECTRRCRRPGVGVGSRGVLGHGRGADALTVVDPDHGDSVHHAHSPDGHAFR
jgi:hypothetical protein